MKPNTTIETERLILRHWNKHTDAEAFYHLHNDPVTMEFFPARRTREQSDELLHLVETMIEKNGYGWTAIALKETGAIIGFGGLAAVPADFPNGPATEIGWRLLPHYFGKGYATESAIVYRNYAFEELGLDRLISFAVHNNEKSFRVMNKIGMREDVDAAFDHPRITQENALHLRRHRTFMLTRSQWLKEKAATR